MSFAPVLSLRGARNFLPRRDAGELIEFGAGRFALRNGLLPATIRKEFDLQALRCCFRLTCAVQRSGRLPCAAGNRTAAANRTWLAWSRANLGYVATGSWRLPHWLRETNRAWIRRARRRRPYGQARHRSKGTSRSPGTPARILRRPEPQAETFRSPDEHALGPQ
jgi:hypothetical protein